MTDEDNIQLLERCFRDLLEIRGSRAGVKEESYYDALSPLLNGLGRTLRPRVRCIHEPADRGAGHPDGGLFTVEQLKQAKEQEPLLGQMPARGVIEVKPAGDDARMTVESKQVTKYWEHYGLVLVTNYKDSVLVGGDPERKPIKLESYRLADGEADFWTKVALLTRRTNCLVSSLLASACASAGLRSSGTARSFHLGGNLPPVGGREQTT